MYPIKSNGANIFTNSLSPWKSMEIHKLSIDYPSRSPHIRIYFPVYGYIFPMYWISIGDIWIRIGYVLDVIWIGLGYQFWLSV